MESVKTTIREEYQALLHVRKALFYIIIFLSTFPEKEGEGSRGREAKLSGGLHRRQESDTSTLYGGISASIADPTF